MSEHSPTDSASAGPSTISSPRSAIVPAGWFGMGCNTGRSDERPAHRVYLHAFAVALLPVTNAEYARFVAAGHPCPRFWHDLRFNAPDQPVVGVTWADAVAYCDWLTRLSNHCCRLPTEAEWEKASLGGREGSVYPWGNAVPHIEGVPLSELTMDRPAPVKRGPLNPLGIAGMGWNIHEWCSDWYDSAYYRVTPRHNPRGPESGVRRSSRGGAWRHQVKISRCAARSAIPPELAYSDYGFRIFADIEDAPR
jgi:sulfatase modifying factor 1